VTYDLIIRSAKVVVFVFVLAITGLAGLVETALSQPIGSAGSDTSEARRGSRPQFYLVNGWEATVAQAEHTSTGEPLPYSVERLCKLHNIQFDPRTVWRENRSLFAWPQVLSSDVPNATRQRTEARALFDANGLSYRELIPLDLSPGALADSLATSVANNEPVLINAPQAPIVYGYDRREPDHWWWFDLGGIPEIELESERTSQFTMWSDDPAAGVAWIVSGAVDYFAQDPDSVDWAFLTRLNASVQGIPEQGIDPYPLSLRRFRDMLASTDSLPLSEVARNSDDPLGILRAKSARERVVEVLQTVSGRVTDSAQSGPLRLTEYHLHGAVATLQELADLVYGESVGSEDGLGRTVKIDNLQVRTRALQLVTELLKSEKLATESLAVALSVHEASGKAPTKKSTAPRPKRRGR